MRYAKVSQWNDKEKRLVMINNSDIIDITTGEIIDTHKYDSIEIVLTNITWVWCGGNDRHNVFEFIGYR